MKFEPTKNKTTNAIYCFLVLAATILFGILIFYIGNILNYLASLFGYIVPVLLGFVIAFILNPLLKKIEKLVDKLYLKVVHSKINTKPKRIISIIITYLTFSIIILTFFWILLPQIVESISELIKKVPSAIDSINDFYKIHLRDFLINLKSYFNSVLSEQQFNEFNTYTSKIFSNFDTLTSHIGELTANLLSMFTKLIYSTVSNFLNLAFGYIISIYFLLSKETLGAQLSKLVTAIFPNHAVRVLKLVVEKTNRIFSSYIFGALLDATIVGSITFIFMSIAGFFNNGWWQYSILISLIIASTNVIPYFGPFLGTAPAALMLLTIDPTISVIFIVFILILQQIDANIISPTIVGSTIGLPPLWVLFALMFFGGMLGILGMFIGVPLFTVIYALTRDFTNYLLTKKNLPTDTNNYFST